jgi:hypothetical protein
MSKWSAIVGAALTAIPLGVAAEEWHFGRFSIQWPAGFQRAGDPQLNQYLNSAGIGVTVDGPGWLSKSTNSDEALKGAYEYAHGPLVELAKRHGAISLPLREEHLNSGSTLYWLAVDGGVKGSEHFGVLFLDVSKAGRTVQFSIEGPGFAQPFAQQFRAVMETEQWSE